MRRSVRAAVRLTVGLVVLTGATRSWATSPLTTWTIQPSPNPSPYSENILYGVTVASQSNAWAAGSFDAAGGFNHTLILHYDGSTWTQQTSKNPSKTDNQLFGIKALSSTSVWAVGSFQNNGSGRDRVLIEHYDGTNWTRQIGISFKNRDNSLHGVSVVNASNVWAVGRHCLPGSLTTGCAPLIENFDGISWHLSTSAASPCTDPVDERLNDVSAASSTDVWAVGSCRESEGEPDSVWIEHFDGASWASQAFFSTTGDLYGVSADASDDAWAVGFDNPGGVLFEHWDGFFWLPVATDVLGQYLNDVKALSPTDAWAVGNSIGGTATLVAHWDGKTWTTQSSENTGEFDGFLGVGASSSTNAFAVGQYRDNGGFTLIEQCCPQLGSPSS